MSHIPNKAMPHAGGNPEHRQPDGLDNSDGNEESGSALGRLGDKARDNPKTAIAVGVAITAGIAAAVAVPVARAARRRSGEEAGGKEASRSKSKSKNKE